MEDNLIGKCGFFCGSCPTYIKGECKGCRMEHSEGDCYTFDCVERMGLNYCGECKNFPCDEIMNREKATVLDKHWMAWKKDQLSARE